MNRSPAAEITDEQIEKAIAEVLSGSLAGEHTTGSLREGVTLLLRCYSLQTRRIARVAWTMAQKGAVQVREIPGDFGLTLLRYSAAR
jgi:hypothetical protein